MRRCVAACSRVAVLELQLLFLHLHQLLSVAVVLLLCDAPWETTVFRWQTIGESSCGPAVPLLVVWGHSGSEVEPPHGLDVIQDFSQGGPAGS